VVIVTLIGADWRAFGTGLVHTWAAGASAVAVFNRGATNATRVAVKWSDVGVPAGRKVTAARELWADRPVPLGSDGVVLDAVDAHDTVVLRIETAQRSQPG